MFGYLYYKYIEFTQGVVFNGEESDAKLIASIEVVVYLFLLFWAFVIYAEL